LQTLISVSWTH